MGRILLPKTQTAATNRGYPPKAGLLFAPVNTHLDVLQYSQAFDNGYIVERDHRLLGKVQMPGYPLTFTDMETPKWLPAADFGENSAEILTELGFAYAEIEAFGSAGVVHVLSAAHAAGLRD